MQSGIVLVLGIAVAGLGLAALLQDAVVPVLGWVLGVLVFVGWVSWRWVHVPITDLSRQAQSLAQRRPDGAPPVLRGDWSALSQSLTLAGEAHRADAQALAAERAARRGVESRLAEAEERYALALRGASDGLWEHDVAGGRMVLSPRWHTMHGYAADELPPEFRSWTARLHPADRDRVEAQLAAHLDGEADRFVSEHRTLHRDGSTRWVLSQAVALRDSQGRPVRVMGIDTDITSLKRVEDVLMHVAEGTSSATGEAFFRSMVEHFARSLGVRLAFITECLDDPPTRVRALACWRDGDFVDNLEYDLDGTPCKTVIGAGETVLHPRGIAELFPKERGLGVESYLGVPIRDVRGRVVGHLAFLDAKPMDSSVLLTAVYRIFAARAAAEMARARVERAVLAVADRLFAVRGSACFEVLVREFATLLGVREAFVCECLPQVDARGHPTHVRMLAHWNRGAMAPAVAFDLAGTTCEDVVQGATQVFVPSGVGARWPREAQYAREAYLGIPCFDADRRVIGHIAAMHGEAMSTGLPDSAVLKLFAERGAIEIERRRLSRPARTAAGRPADPSMDRKVSRS